MRVFAFLAALALIAAPVAGATSAYADGIERPPAPLPRPRPQQRVQAPPPAPIPAPVLPAGPETVTLPASFFMGGGGVGTEIGAGYVGGGTTVIVRGGSASAFAFASASARASGGGHGGSHGGCGGCGGH
ncbi:MAG: hypothetical protein NW206_01680 [Hyphomonadaceae bacterium]|nr:hypothetical protein [Hyphomonadaceae bacterium]